MKKLKICVYAISKNEEKFVKRWFNSVNEADEVFVLDTGSTDNTVNILKKLGAKVTTKKIEPWRFDVARNESLKLVPKDYDICVCMDLDEVISKGWRKKLEMLWKNNVNHLRYNYNWSHDKNGNPKVNFYIEKIHARKDFTWTHPVHEVLKYTGDKEVWKTTDEITVDHYPDDKKSRSSYLPLLELSVKEDPKNDRNMHYLGREYMFYERYNDAIDTLIKHLSLKSATWKDERCASMRFIARCYKYLKRYEESRMWLDKAIIEAPYLRDPYVERALLEYELKNWELVKKYLTNALKINKHTKSYINEPFSFDYTIFDLLSISEFYLGNVDESIKWIDKAIEMDPSNKRLLNNKKIIIEKKNSI
ncbi:MAG: glycosyltransferase [Bacilli bacterium]|nr:glycosyltransferase [Bacilli bacterium]